MVEKIYTKEEWTTIIAAASDSYEALKHICDRLYNISRNEKLVSPELYSLLRALYRHGYDAIAKANGKKTLAKAEGK